MIYYSRGIDLKATGLGILFLTAMLALTMLVAGYEHEDKGPIRGGVSIDENGNYSIDVNYYIPMSDTDTNQLDWKFRNQTILKARVRLQNLTTGEDDWYWNITLRGSGFVDDGRVFLYSFGNTTPPEGRWKYEEYIGTEVIETEPYLKW